MLVINQWTEQHVRRLFWRAGFGATPEEVAAWAQKGRAATLEWILDGGGGSELVGPKPTVNGGSLDPANEWGHDVLWWLDRMVRSQRPLVEKMTLFWHDHFATADQDPPLLLAQNKLFRRNALGNFKQLLTEVAKDPAMQLFLSLADSVKEAPNENFARELMELFTLGSGYSERDIREAARALTGFRSRYSNRKLASIRYDRRAHDAGRKTVFGKRGKFDWKDVLALVTTHRKHAPFLVEKLWNFFITAPIDSAAKSQLAAKYRASGLEIKPVVKAILEHPALYAKLDQPDMVKAPAVAVAGALRTTGQTITRDDWVWLMQSMGQELFHPPSVAGWDWGPAWLSTNTMRARFVFATNMLDEHSPLAVAEGSTPLDLTTAEAVELARKAVAHPWSSAETDAALQSLADHFLDDLSARRRANDELRQERSDMLQSVLRHFLLSGPDAQVH